MRLCRIPLLWTGRAMGINVVIQWSVPEGREPEVDAALRVISDHIREAHPGIQACRVFGQFAGGEPHRACGWRSTNRSRPWTPRR